MSWVCKGHPCRACQLSCLGQQQMWCCLAQQAACFPNESAHPVLTVTSGWLAAAGFHPHHLHTHPIQLTALPILAPGRGAGRGMGVDGAGRRGLRQASRMMGGGSMGTMALQFGMAQASLAELWRTGGLRLCGGSLLLHSATFTAWKRFVALADAFLRYCAALCISRQPGPLGAADSVLPGAALSAKL